MTAAAWTSPAGTPEVPPGALDPELVTRRLAPFLGGGAQHRVVAAEVVALASGRRAVIAYRTAGDADGARPSLIGKTYVDPVRAPRLHRLLEDLSALDIAAPRPVAHLPELRMAVFGASSGRPIDRLNGAERVVGVVMAAHWLSTLHAAPLRLDRRLDPAAETRRLDAWARIVADRDRAAAAPAALLGARLTALSSLIRPSARSPIHKDFHYQHALVEPGRMVVIDLDEVRAGDRAVDVAHFAANLRLLAMRQGITSGEPANLESVFVEAYAARTGYERDARHRWFGAYTCLKIARQLVCGRGPAPVPAGAELERQVGLILEEGLRWLTG
ncbi:MAG TPA: phosphotransferase [Candidatus Dormibacteraeota bacterium]|nr:phosphotransferase [Candidatus Dormibacteraeota bacterium]